MRNPILEIASSLALLAMTKGKSPRNDERGAIAKGGVIASDRRERGNLGGGVFLEIASGSTESPQAS